MNIVRKCPQCNTSLSVNVGHEWEKINGRYEMTLRLLSQSTNIDTAKMEVLFPIEPDGQDLIAEPLWVDDGVVDVKLYRRPRKEGQAVQTVAAKQSRSDLETQAAELGLEVNPKWSDLQLMHALSEKKKERK